MELGLAPPFIYLSKKNIVALYRSGRGIKKREHRGGSRRDGGNRQVAREQQTDIDAKNLHKKKKGGDEKGVRMHRCQGKKKNSQNYFVRCGRAITRIALRTYRILITRPVKSRETTAIIFNTCTRGAHRTEKKKKRRKRPRRRK